MKNNITNKPSGSVRKKIGILKDRIKRKNKNIRLEDLTSDLISAGLVSELEEKHKTDKRYGFILKERGSGDYSLDNIKVGYKETFKTREQDQIGKLCYLCKQRKSRDEFHKSKGRNDGLEPTCKKCDGLEPTCKKCRVIVDSRPRILASKMYSRQKQSSIRRGHPLPDYDRKWLTEWLMSRDNFKDMHTKWIESNMESDLRPSVDRINPLKPYTKDNIQLVTWGENKKKAYNIDSIIRKDHKDNKDLYKGNLDMPLRKISMARAICEKHFADAKSKGIKIEYSQDWLRFLLIRSDKFAEKFIEAVKNNSKEMIKVKIERLNLDMPFSKTNIKITF